MTGHVDDQSFSKGVKSNENNLSDAASNFIADWRAMTNVQTTLLAENKTLKDDRDSLTIAISSERARVKQLTNALSTAKIENKHLLAEIKHLEASVEVDRARAQSAMVAHAQAVKLNRLELQLKAEELAISTEQVIDLRRRLQELIESRREECNNSPLFLADLTQSKVEDTSLTESKSKVEDTSLTESKSTAKHDATQNEYSLVDCNSSYTLSLAEDIDKFQEIIQQSSKIRKSPSEVLRCEKKASIERTKKTEHSSKKRIYNTQLQISTTPHNKSILEVSSKRSEKIYFGPIACIHSQKIIEKTKVLRKYKKLSLYRNISQTGNNCSNWTMSMCISSDDIGTTANCVAITACLSTLVSLCKLHSGENLQIPVNFTELPSLGQVTSILRSNVHQKKTENVAGLSLFVGPYLPLINSCVASGSECGFLKLIQVLVNNNYNELLRLMLMNAFSIVDETSAVIDNSSEVSAISTTGTPLAVMMLEKNQIEILSKPSELVSNWLEETNSDSEEEDIQHRDTAKTLLPLHHQDIVKTAQVTRNEQCTCNSSDVSNYSNADEFTFSIDDSSSFSGSGSFSNPEVTTVARGFGGPEAASEDGFISGDAAFRRLSHDRVEDQKAFLAMKVTKDGKEDIFLKYFSKIHIPQKDKSNAMKKGKEIIMDMTNVETDEYEKKPENNNTYNDDTDKNAIDLGKGTCHNDSPSQAASTNIIDPDRYSLAPTEGRPLWCQEAGQADNSCSGSFDPVTYFGMKSRPLGNAPWWSNGGRDRLGSTESGSVMSCNSERLARNRAPFFRTPPQSEASSSGGGSVASCCSEPLSRNRHRGDENSIMRPSAFTLVSTEQITGTQQSQSLSNGRQNSTNDRNGVWSSFTSTPHSTPHPDQSISSGMSRSWRWRETRPNVSVSRRSPNQGRFRLCPLMDRHGSIGEEDDEDENDESMAEKDHKTKRPIPVSRRNSTDSCRVGKRSLAQSSRRNSIDGQQMRKRSSSTSSRRYSTDGQRMWKRKSFPKSSRRYSIDGQRVQPLQEKSPNIAIVTAPKGKGKMNSKSKAKIKKRVAISTTPCKFVQTSGTNSTNNGDDWLLNSTSEDIKVGDQTQKFSANFLKTSKIDYEVEEESDLELISADIFFKEKCHERSFVAKQSDINDDEVCDSENKGISRRSRHSSRDPSPLPLMPTSNDNPPNICNVKPKTSIKPPSANIPESDCVTSTNDLGTSDASSKRTHEQSPIDSDVIRDDVATEKSMRSHSAADCIKNIEDGGDADEDNDEEDECQKYSGRNKQQLKVIIPGANASVCTSTLTVNPTVNGQQLKLPPLHTPHRKLGLPLPRSNISRHSHGMAVICRVSRDARNVKPRGVSIASSVASLEQGAALRARLGASSIVSGSINGGGLSRSRSNSLASVGYLAGGESIDSSCSSSAGTPGNVLRSCRQRGEGDNETQLPPLGETDRDCLADRSNVSPSVVLKSKENVNHNDRCGAVSCIQGLKTPLNEGRRGNCLSMNSSSSSSSSSSGSGESVAQGGIAMNFRGHAITRSALERQALRSLKSSHSLSVSSALAPQVERYRGKSCTRFIRDRKGLAGDKLKNNNVNIKVNEKRVDISRNASESSAENGAPEIALAIDPKSTSIGLSENSICKGDVRRDCKVEKNVDDVKVVSSLKKNVSKHYKQDNHGEISNAGVNANNSNVSTKKGKPSVASVTSVAFRQSGSFSDIEVCSVSSISHSSSCSDPHSFEQLTYPQSLGGIIIGDTSSNSKMSYITRQPASKSNSKRSNNESSAFSSVAGPVRKDCSSSNGEINNVALENTGSNGRCNREVLSTITSTAENTITSTTENTQTESTCQTSKCRLPRGEMDSPAEVDSRKDKGTRRMTFPGALPSLYHTRFAHEEVIEKLKALQVKQLESETMKVRSKKQTPVVKSTKSDAVPLGQKAHVATNPPPVVPPVQHKVQQVATVVPSPSIILTAKKVKVQHKEIRQHYNGHQQHSQSRGPSPINSGSNSSSRGASPFIPVSLRLKCRYKNDTRMMKIDSNCVTLGNLLSRVRKMFRGQSKPSLYWKDSYGDFITLYDQDDLDTYLEVVTELGQNSNRTSEIYVSFDKTFDSSCTRSLKSLQSMNSRSNSHSPNMLAPPNSSASIRLSPSFQQQQFQQESMRMSQSIQQQQQFQQESMRLSPSILHQLQKQQQLQQKEQKETVKDKQHCGRVSPPSAFTKVSGKVSSSSAQAQSVGPLPIIAEDCLTAAAAAVGRGALTPEPLRILAPIRSVVPMRNGSQHQIVRGAEIPQGRMINEVSQHTLMHHRTRPVHSSRFTDSRTLQHAQYFDGDVDIDALTHSCGFRSMQRNDPVRRCYISGHPSEFEMTGIPTQSSVQMQWR